MPATQPRDQPNAAPARDALRAAFQDLHARRLHGFALLLTLGDARRAAQLTGEAMARGSARVDRLRHPERAAAWLRARVVEWSRWTPVTRRRTGGDLAALERMGADSGVVAGLASLGRVERAAFIAAAVERLDVRDVGDIVGRQGPGLQRLLERARGRYTAAYVAAMPGEAPGDGPLATRLRQLARRTIA